MIQANLSGIDSVEDFLTEIRSQQEAAHGEDYCLIHDAIKKWSAGLETYTELGVNQGGTASQALLSGFKHLYLIDINLSNYKATLESLAQKYAEENDIKIEAIQSSSLSPTLNHIITDMLLIDSLHSPGHLRQELRSYAPRTRRIIIAHDTAMLGGVPNRSLYHTIKEFVGDEEEWVILEDNTQGVGYTVIGKP